MSPDRVSPKSRGFTLIELMVVVLIISILIAAVLVGVPKIKRAVYGAQTQAQLSAIAGAIQQYYDDYKAYPGPLANNQLACGYDVPANVPNADGAQLQLESNPSYSWTSGAFLDPHYITGSENLVLGLCGGLRVVPPSFAGAEAVFGYYPEDLFAPDGVTPAPKGPPSLNPNLPKKQQAYITLKPGDISVPNLKLNGGKYTDSAGRFGHDSMVPEFMDKYADPLPIIYYRNNVGGTAIVGFRNSAKMGGPQLSYTDPNFGTTTTLTAQYDLLQNYGYMDNSNSGTAQIGVIANNSNSMHGLKGLDLTGNLSFPIDTTVNGTNLPGNTVSPGMNAIAYFKDPTLNDPVNSTNVHLGVARQKDGYLLISAGPDRQYGTHDDLVYPGPLIPAQ